ncbi:MAG: hypothetical protein JST65_04770 [Acidobacteria bacterium]|nr:hypothetical protein [Acidobacteriota bacterium]
MVKHRSLPTLTFVALLANAVAQTAPEPPKEPQITSVYPIAGTTGQPFEVTIRGKNLLGSKLVWFTEPQATATIIDTKDDAVRARVTFAVPRDSYGLRVITGAGMSNALKLRAETAGEGRTYDGQIANPGDIATYTLHAKAGETYSFDVKSGFKAMDPMVTISQKTGSWFDPERLQPVASNDETLYFPGLSADAHLVHKFDKGGEYLVRVASFTGQGGPDHVYRLTITPGATPAPSLHPQLGPSWEERQFTRAITGDWISQLEARGNGAPAKDTVVETFRAVPENGNGPVPSFVPPGLVEGRITNPAEAHVIDIRIDKAQELAVEIETPEATMPRFNPVVRLMEPNGHELVTNVYTKLNNNGLYMMKMIQAKTAFSLTAPGVYRMQIRNITTDQGGADFRYRILVRPQVPHIGKMVTSVEHVNLHPGESRAITVTLDREEEFGGTVALSVDGLPAGVIAVPALEKPVERPPLPNGGRLERYVPKPQTASVLLIADERAQPIQVPVPVRVIARAVVKGQLRDAVPVAEIPFLLVAKP